LEEIENGRLDQVDPFPVPENFWPTQSQTLKINKAIVARNHELDGHRALEVAERNKTFDLFKQDMERWEGLEKKRKVELEKLKKLARIANLKFDVAMERVNRARSEFNENESFLLMVKDIQRLHENSKDRFKMMRMKHYLEFNRQHEYIENIKKRLFLAMRARKYAFELPGTAKNCIEFSQWAQQAEEALRILKVEIFDCKELLYQEGVRLRTLFR